MDHQAEPLRFPHINYHMGASNHLDIDPDQASLILYFALKGPKYRCSKLSTDSRIKTMFLPITIPFDCVMLFNRVHLKEGITAEDVELELGEMCNVVKNNYGDKGGFIAGQVFEFTGFASAEGSLNRPGNEENHIAILTYWKSFDDHEKSHADKLFKEKFGALLENVDEADELGYRLLWQGEPEQA
jgi:hypothetical protein